MTSKKSPSRTAKKRAKKKAAPKKARVERKTATKKKVAKKRGRKPQNLPTAQESLIEQGKMFLLEPVRTGNVGRPTKYSKAICDHIPSMFENGESIAEVCVALGISKDTFALWREKYPEFSEAVKDGLSRSEAWWIKLGRLGGAGMVKIQPVTWIFNMKNRFDWKDKTETEHTGEVASRLVIGGPSDPSDWEAAAKRQQEIMSGAK